MDITSEAIAKASNEELAQMLKELDSRSDWEYEHDKEAYNTTLRYLKAIGEKLNADGGEDLMIQVLQDAGALGCNTRFIEREWNGIGSWWG